MKGLSMRQLTIEEFDEVNTVELDCIFAETGADRESCFDRESRVETMWFDEDFYHKAYPQLQYEDVVRVEVSV